MGNQYEDRLKDYVTVDQRILAFYKEHPQGVLQSEIVELTAVRVVVKAYAYRTPDDSKPGIGHSSMNIPGSTPYTKGSEVENAETSAWGRAIASLGFEVKKGIATRNEIENKADEPDRARTMNGKAPVIASDAQRKLLLKSAKTLMGEKEGKQWVLDRMKDLGIAGPDDFDIGHWQMCLNELNQLRAGQESQEPPAEDSDVPF